MKKVGIIGGAGFIGSHITRVFLNHGFEAKVSVTDISRQDKYKHLTELENSGNLYITELNIENKNQLQQFVQDCDLVIHGGTPFQLEVSDPKSELFDPTIRGTENFLEAISNTPSVEKVVIIASVASLNTNFPLPPDNTTPLDVMDELSPKFISKESHPYAQAKFIANQTVEKYIEEHPGIHFEISSVSPVMVMGRSLSSREDSTSSGLQFLIKNGIAPNDFIRFLYDVDALFAIVDVRDVAEAVYKAATRNGIHGKNYLLSSESWRISDLRLMLNGEDPNNKPLTVYRNNLAKSDLSVDFRPVRETLSSFSNG